MAPILLILAAVALAILALKWAWENNLGDIQGKTAVVLSFLGGAFQTVTSVIGAAWGAIGPILEAGLGGILAPIRTVISVVEGALSLIARFTNTPIQPPSVPNVPSAPETFIGQRVTRPIIPQISDLIPASDREGNAGFFTPEGHFISAFAQGGIVGGPVGAPQLVVAHGGEEIGRPGRGDVHVHLEGSTFFGLIDFEQQIKRIVRDAFPRAVGAWVSSRRTSLRSTGRATARPGSTRRSTS